MNQRNRTRKLALAGVFIALSVVGGLIKIPSPVTSIALDSAPGFYCALAFGPLLGFLTTSIGHLMSALTGGFPLGLPMHLIVGLGMGIIAVIFSLMGRKNIPMLLAGIILAALLNSYVLGLTVLPIMGKAGYLAVAFTLLIVATVNLILASALYLILKKFTNKPT